MKEDACPIYRGDAAQILATVRHMALNMLRAEKGKTASIRRKQKIAAMNSDYLEQVILAGITAANKNWALMLSPWSIPAKFTETDPELNKKLDAFRNLAQKKLCKFWETSAELSGIVGRSIVQLKKRSPATGWVKADLVPSEDSAQEILKLKNEIERLKDELKSTASTEVSPDELSQGNDFFEFEYTGKAKIDFLEYLESKFTAAISWNTIFAALAPLMADESDEQSLQNRFRQLILKTEETNMRSKSAFKERELLVSVEHDVFDTMIVQFRALGLIQKSKRNRSVKDKKTYWCLTEKGDNLLVGLKAIKKI